MMARQEEPRLARFQREERERRERAAFEAEERVRQEQAARLLGSRPVQRPLIAPVDTPPAEHGWHGRTGLPNAMLDWVIPSLPEAEMRVLLYIARRTYGFGKDQDTISINQFVKGMRRRNGDPLDAGAGLARLSVQRGIKGLESRGLIAVERPMHGAEHETSIYRITIADDWRPPFEPGRGC